MAKFIIWVNMTFWLGSAQVYYLPLEDSSQWAAAFTVSGLLSSLLIVVVSAIARLIRRAICWRRMKAERRKYVKFTADDIRF